MVGQLSKYTLEYLYGQDGIIAIVLDGRKYYYRRNIQGDITKIFSIDGRIQACYTYNAWGNHIVTDASGTIIYDSKNGITVGYENHIGNINPIRYRGYYYDADIALYYCESRYYDPEVGRWINVDDIAYLDPETINGLNLYAYCGNNPVMFTDSTGTSRWTDFWKTLKVGLVGALIVGGLVVTSIFTGGAAGAVILGAAIGAGFGGAMGLGSAAMSGNNLWAGMFGGMLTGAAISATGALGGLAGTGVLAGSAVWSALGIGVGSGIIAGMGRYTINTIANGLEFSLGKMFLDGGLTALESATSFGIGAAFAGGGAWKMVNRVEGSQVIFAGGGKIMNTVIMGLRVYFTNVLAKGSTFPFRYAFL